MAIRLRQVNGIWIALCAARSMPDEGDVYLDDNQHAALVDKFGREYGQTFECDLPHDASVIPLVDQEESNNPNRTWWDSVYGSDSS